ncbi:MAG: GTP-binding protein, partial [Nitratireductor sp.]
DITLYVISVCQGEDIPRKGGPAITRSDLLIINKQDLAPHVGANLDTMKSDAQNARTTPNGEGAFVFTDMRRGENIEAVVSFIEDFGGLKSI